MKKHGKEAVPRQSCPYEGCDQGKVWFWGWYWREEGAIPLAADQAAGKIPLRRFKCLGCGRTFSWRPAFLVFARRYAAQSYQRALEALARSHVQRFKDSPWYELSESCVKALRSTLENQLQDRLALDHDRPPWPELWSWLNRQAAQQQPRLAVHLLCIALARHPDGTRYRLSAF